ncbi:unnamed protein product [Brachionus calyciflorus]|uniref:S-adenosylmethionine mitochondrial carrier protein n=1 Tax=Brachionus calyciflorus TaxID=104777 RepID=A0A814AF13_9BILA|nr:unnamed protein product [Brachionus calyciflorus]
MTDRNFLISLISGAAAGTGVDLILFPLDTVKTRIQSQKGFRASGGFRGIYNGLPSTLVGSAPTAALFFTVYDTTKSKLEPYVHKNITPTISQIIAANLGEISACLIRVPVDVIKQRTQAQQSLSTFQVFKNILKIDGIRGFYRSYLTTVLREIPFGSIQFPLWEYLKLQVSKKTKSGECQPFQSAICGAIAGGISAGITTPIDVAKTRITLSKDNTNHKGKILGTIKAIYAENGIRGVFAGIYPRVTMISFGGFIFFGMYEETKKITTKLFSR